MLNTQNKQAAAALESMLLSLNVPCIVDDIMCNNFSIFYKLTPQGKTTVNKLKRITLDLSIYFQNPQIIIDNGLYLKIDNVSGNRQYYNFFDYAERSEKEKIPLYCGIDEKNNKVILDLSTLPHLLIAGATGTGKSIFIHDLILSLLTQDNNLLLIDPKIVELSLYKNTRGVNVITDISTVIPALENAYNLMIERYKQLERSGETDAHNIYKPYIIIIDELSDIMLNKETKKQAELLISKIAAMGRAANIHLIIATQRPSVNVLTGLIKANIPARISFTCASAIDSRCILDRKGAETLQGKGDAYIKLCDCDNFIRIQAYNNTIQDIKRFILPLQTQTETRSQTQKAGFFRKLFA
jgi:DNA segregation ATPase FtsK/SpoIIIE-like protein